MKFKFKLETLLKHRKTLEELARRDYMEAKSLVDQQLKVIEEYYTKIDETRQRSARQQEEGSANGPQLASLDQFIRGQLVKIEREKEKARELMAVAEEKHDLLVEAAKEYKILERLKDKKNKEFKKEQSKREKKEQDEMVTMRTGRAYNGI